MESRFVELKLLITFAVSSVDAYRKTDEGESPRSRGTGSGVFVDRSILSVQLSPSKRHEQDS
jgi:hypothetical protein